MYDIPFNTNQCLWWSGMFVPQMYPMLMQQFTSIEQEKEILRRNEEIKRKIALQEYNAHISYIECEQKIVAEMTGNKVPAASQQKKIYEMRENFVSGLNANRQKAYDEIVKSVSPNSAPSTPQQLQTGFKPKTCNSPTRFQIKF